jgi:hypothetical protein
MKLCFKQAEVLKELEFSVGRKERVDRDNYFIVVFKITKNNMLHQAF